MCLGTQSSTKELAVSPGKCADIWADPSGKDGRSAAPLGKTKPAELCMLEPASTALERACEDKPCPR